MALTQPSGPHDIACYEIGKLEPEGYMVWACDQANL